ncbi:hypothetical protein [Mycobacterium sp. 1245805.9]|uniref:hypothetical protein n=1 Tax=Mycobacterium sp. 1245805.9 TaxID=1856862 RepID=UPI0007FD4587|nr:hypothetical protein [Mycobacterium sp. 1245805.9]OBI88797.1 hypothetical protein A9X00_22370 [Mycobacterium sp. 1245805.9]
MATTVWTLVSILVIAPLGALAVDRPLYGNWIWHIDADKPRDYGELPAPPGNPAPPSPDDRGRQLTG